MDGVWAGQTPAVTAWLSPLTDRAIAARTLDLGLGYWLSGRVLLCCVQMTLIFETALEFFEFNNF